MMIYFQALHASDLEDLASWNVSLIVIEAIAQEIVCLVRFQFFTFSEELPLFHCHTSLSKRHLS